MSERFTCHLCKVNFLSNSKLPPLNCGGLLCRALDEWTQERWDGAARMAHAREETGGHLTTLDQEALSREAF